MCARRAPAPDPAKAVAPRWLARSQTLAPRERSQASVSLADGHGHRFVGIKDELTRAQLFIVMVVGVGVEPRVPAPHLTPDRDQEGSREGGEDLAPRRSAACGGESEGGAYFCTNSRSSNPGMTTSMKELTSSTLYLNGRGIGHEHRGAWRAQHRSSVHRYLFGLVAFALQSRFANSVIQIGRP